MLFLLLSDKEMMEKIKINAKFQYFMINSKIPTVISCEYFEVNYNESYSYNNKHTSEFQHG